MKRFLLLMFSISFFGLAGYSQQVRSFTADTLAYLDELKRFSANNLNEADKPVFEKFAVYWSTGRFTWNEMKEIVEVSNLLLKKYGRPSPDFSNYFQVLLMVEDDSLGTAGKNFGDWKKIMQSYLGSKETSLKIVQQFLELTLNLFKESVLYKSSTAVWKSMQSNFRFDFNKGKPLVRFNNIDLYCFAKKDSMAIFKTSGSLDPADLKWTGNKGIVTWERAGLPRDSVYAELSDYTLSLRKTEYQADSVIFRYTKYFNYPLEGRLDEQVMSIANPASALYPKFFSYRNKYILPKLFPGIEYIGGLSMQGSKLIGTGSEHEPAFLNIFEKDTLRIILRSRQIQISQNSIISPSVKMTLIIENDSISHPDLTFNYQERTDIVRLTKSDTYTSATPYSNSYHKISMNFDEFSWKRNTREIFFKPMTGRSQGTATFESENFFNYSFWEQLQGKDNIHPLVAIWEYSRGTGFDQFPVLNYANYLGIAPYQVRHQLMLLSRQGFIYFDDAADMVKINRKLNYFLDASIGKTDYDVMYFVSRTQTPQENAKLNLNNYDLHIYGIQNIFLSDSQNVVLLPDKNQIIMKKNRNFSFDGVIKAGLFTFYGSNMFFVYDTFKINLQKIDSLRLEIKTSEKDNYGQYVIKGIDNLIEQVTGQILIDDPGNKSGLKDFPQYPIFTSREDAYVYFDEKEIQNGIYSRKDIRFKVYPFSIDSLDNFSKNGLQMKGLFESGGIIPPMEQTLTLREDNSLGFVYNTPEQGIPVYNGAGTFYNSLEMSNKGLHGSGQLDYLTSTTYSDDFLFHPDSVMTISREFINKKQVAGTSYPQVKSGDNQVLWLTKLDKFNAKTGKTPFTIFSDSVTLAGALLLEPSGLSGEGTLDLKIAAMNSDRFRFKAEQIESDSADFRLKALKGENFAFKTDSVKFQLDFESGKARFQAIKGVSLMEFPENRYVSAQDFFAWDMRKGLLELGLNEKVQKGNTEDSLVGPRYISVVPRQDSLNFVSGHTLFDYRRSIIQALEVPYIQVADSRIYPDNGDLTIESNGYMRPLEKAGIVTDYTNMYYKLFNASVEITGKNNYKGSADYNYVDETNKARVIRFTSIMADTSGHTVGKGSVSSADSFKLSPFFEFQGEVRLSALKPNLIFDGGVRLTHDCSIGRNWFKFEAEIDPDSILIPVSDNPVDMDLNKIYAGSMITRDSAHIYSAFLGPRKDYFDAYLTNALGFLRYDRYKRNYEISTPEKLNNRNKPGNYISLETDSCSVYSEGDINLQVDYGQLKIRTVGKTVNDISSGKFRADVLMSLDFFFSPEALAVFANEIDSLVNLKPFDPRDKFYTLALRDFMGEGKAQAMEEELSLLGTIKEVPPEFNKTMILSNISLTWDQNTRSFMYHGPVGIIRAGNVQINKNVEAYVQFSKRSSGDLLDIYFKVSNSIWYYFSYNPGSLQVTSTNRNFNSIIFELKEKFRKKRVPGSQMGYIYALAPDRRAELFLRRYMDSEDQGDANR